VRLVSKVCHITSGSPIKRKRTDDAILVVGQIVWEMDVPLDTGFTVNRFIKYSTGCGATR